MTKIDRPFALLGILAVTALAASGCAPADPVTPEESSSATETEAESETVELSGPECLVGDWFIEQDQMQVFYDALGSENGGIDFDIEGGTGLSFTATTFSYAPDFTLNMGISGIEASGTITGDIGGDYSADEEVITTSQEINNTALTVTIAGVAQDGSDLFDSFLSASPINSAPYECTADGPLIQFETGGDRVPVQLTSR